MVREGTSRRRACSSVSPSRQSSRIWRWSSRNASNWRRSGASYIEGSIVGGGSVHRPTVGPRPPAPPGTFTSAPERSGAKVKVPHGREVGSEVLAGALGVARLARSARWGCGIPGPPGDGIPWWPVPGGSWRICCSCAWAAICCATSAVWMPWNRPSSHPTSWAWAMRSSASEGESSWKGRVIRSSSSTSSGARPSSSSAIERWWISARRARPFSSSGALRTSSSSCLTIEPIRITLAGCSTRSAGLVGRSRFSSAGGSSCGATPMPSGVTTTTRSPSLVTVAGTPRFSESSWSWLGAVLLAHGPILPHGRAPEGAARRRLRRRPGRPLGAGSGCRCGGAGAATRRPARRRMPLPSP